MRKFDSSKTRVKPLFDHIGTDNKKLNDLFSLFSPKTPKFEKNSILEICFGENEKKIPASKSMLLWLLENLTLLNKVDNYGTTDTKSETYKKRKSLFSGDLNTMAEALNAVNNMTKSVERKWYIFEGKTSPDVYIETEDSIFIGEAKRTERNITTKTLWLNNRDQLIRHIDSLLDQKKNIYSFYLLEGKSFKNYYEKSIKLYSDKSYFESNLKHRNLKEVDRASESFIGYIFWEDLASRFGINFPETVL